MAFIFGGDTGMSYEDIQRKRQVADSLMGSAMRPARNVGEGLAAIGAALAVRGIEKRTKAADEENRRAFNDQWGGIFGGGSPDEVVTQAAYSQPEQVDPNAPEVIAGDAMATIGRGTNKPLSEDVVRQGLIARGMPEHVADGFVMNFRDESGLNPGINEAKPLVPGSRGGFGLAQWTGPRRVALEQFASQSGRDVSDPNVQMDFLMSELQGPEAQAWQAIAAAPDAGTAGAEIVNRFLRPAEEHRSRRAAQYTGGQPIRTAQAGNFDLATLAELAGNPYASPGQKAVLQALIGQQTAAMDPMRAMEMERARLELDQLRNPQVKPININGKLVDPNTYEVVADFSEGPDPTSAMQEYDLARSQGYEGTFADYKRDMAAAGRSSTTVNVGDGNNPGLGKLSTDFGYVLDPATGKPVIDPQTGLPKAAPVPGSPAAREIEAASEKKSLTKEGTARAANVVMQDIDLALKQSEGFGTTGFFGGLFDDVGGTAAHDLQNTLRTVQANIGFDRLQQMREASPTGGALGAVSERELTELQAVLGSVQQSQGKAQLQRNLNRLKALYSDILKKAEAYPNAADFGFVGAQQQGEMSDADYLKSLGLE